MDLYEKIERTAHFGDEFLIWLWFRSHKNDGFFKLPDGNIVYVHFGNRLILETQLAEAEKTNISGGDPAYSKEAMQALRYGKMATQAKISFVKDEKEWSFLLNSKTLSLSSLRIPALMTKADDEKIYERMALLEEADMLLRALFASFLDTRLDNDSWKIESAEITEWIQQENG